MHLASTLWPQSLADTALLILSMLDRNSSVCIPLGNATSFFTQPLSEITQPHNENDFRLGSVFSD